MTTSSSITNFSRCVLVCCSLIVFESACATRHPPETRADTSDSPADSATPPTDLARAQQQLSELQAKYQDLETRLTALNDKMNSKINPEMENKIVQPPIAAVKGNVTTAKSKFDAHGESIAQDEAVDRYREAKILFESNRYSDSVIEFSEFVKNFPHHALAPGAQYFTGAAYFKQKEYKLADEEWNRCLISYPRSQYTADVLKGLMETSDQLKKPEKVAYYEHKLTMLFPNSPQAKSKLSPGSETRSGTESEQSLESSSTPSTSSHSVRSSEKSAPKNSLQNTSLGKVVDRVLANPSPTPRVYPVDEPEKPTAPVAPHGGASEGEPTVEGDSDQ